MAEHQIRTGVNQDMQAMSLPWVKNGAAFTPHTNMLSPNDQLEIQRSKTSAKIRALKRFAEETKDLELDAEDRVELKKGFLEEEQVTMSATLLKRLLGSVDPKVNDMEDMDVLGKLSIEEVEALLQPFKEKSEAAKKGPQSQTSP